VRESDPGDPICKIMKSRFLFASLSALGVAALVIAFQGNMRSARQSWPGWSSDKTAFTLFNGWRITPVGKGIDLPGDMPGSIIFVDGGKKVLVNTAGYHDHSLNLVNLESGQIESTLKFDRNWIGLAQKADGEFWLSGGKVEDPAKHKAILKIKNVNGKLEQTSGIDLEGIAPRDRFVSSILPGPNGNYVLNVQSDEVLLTDEAGQIKQRTKVGYRPYMAALSPDGLHLAVSNWGDQSISILDAKTLTSVDRIKVEQRPTAVVYTKDSRLFVSNAGSDSVSVITNGLVSATIRTGFGGRSKVGSTPVHLAVSPDQNTLFVANAGNNCVTVVDIANPKSAKVTGYIPTERYPVLVSVTPDGKKLLIGTAKGNYGPNAGSKVTLEGAQIRGQQYGAPYRYIGQQLTGRLTILDVPSADELQKLSAKVKENMPDQKALLASAEFRDIERNALRKIKHVIYVIRENRTFDQVLGDLGRGNCDPSLTIFPRRVTPNGHKLADTFATYDNFYADGETSQAGHQWADAAYASDYCEKQWVLGYGRHGQVDSDKRLTSSPGEYLWSQARKHGLKARVYGEYVDVQEDHNSLNDPELRKDPEKYGYSAKFEEIFARGGRDTEKVDEFLREMREAEKNGGWPNLMVMALPDDHTHGFSAGSLSPYAMVGDNDLAVGNLVEAVSKSKFWKETAIFVVQDDAQDGPDHVDSHRTVAYVASPYAKRGILDSTHYSTASMLRTMGLMLGLPPLTQFDEAATPMINAFTTKPNFAAFTKVQPGIDLNERNPSGTKLAQGSAKLDFSEVDRADFGELNRILWEGYKPGIPYPAEKGKH